MKIILAAIGRLKRGPETELAARYLERARKTGRAAGIADISVIELSESPAKSAKQRQEDEAARLLAALPERTCLVALDEAGKALASRQLSALICDAAANGGQTLAFAIGGPDGHGQSLLRRADTVLSFGPATWPHQLVRAMLAEQIYRSTTIMTNHPYHRD